ncbi:glycine-rich RNA-binding protein 4, mitochondrial [Trifolium repens]|nr:glycine-rich RNA-binding protein 4, mitochondrial [Trifolium repens]
MVLLSYLGNFESLSLGKTEMAFCNKIGNLLRQGATQTSQAPVSSMLNYLRHMSSSKLFVGGLSYGVDDQSLRDAFATYGEVIEARVITDRDTGRSRGFGFVNYTSEDAAGQALAMDGQDLNGRPIRVSYANDRPSGPRPGGGGGYGDGGGRYGGGGGGGGW